MIRGRDASEVWRDQTGKWLISSSEEKGGVRGAGEGETTGRDA